MRKRFHKDNLRHLSRFPNDFTGTKRILSLTRQKLEWREIRDMRSITPAHTLIKRRPVMRMKQTRRCLNKRPNDEDTEKQTLGLSFMNLVSGMKAPWS